MISPGQPAYIVLDSMPDQRFRGHVTKVGLLPDTTSRWGNPNLKVYATEILVTDAMPDVKPGVSARAEVVITNLHNVISVPLQAVTTRDGKPVVYVASGDESKPVNVEVGLYNTKLIEVTSGLNEGDRILLSPPFDTQQKDLGGAILAEGEDLGTNAVNMAKGAAQRGGPGHENEESQAQSANGPPSSRRAPPGGDDGGSAAVVDGAGAGRGQRPNFDEIRKRFDKNGDGELDESERQAMPAAFGGPAGGQPAAGGRPRRPGGDVPAEGGTRGERRNREPRPEGRDAEGGRGRAQSATNE